MEGLLTCLQLGVQNLKEQRTVLPTPSVSALRVVQVGLGDTDIRADFCKSCAVLLHKHDTLLLTLTSTKRSENLRRSARLKLNMS